MINLTIEVTDIGAIIALYNQIRIYTSDTEDGTYTYLDVVSLQSGVSDYNYIHLQGTTDTWYKSSYYNSSTSDESSLSNAARGTAPSLYHVVSYPQEYDFDADEEIMIRKIRRLIGDFKGLENLYADGTEFCSSILEDNKTIDLGEKSWPVYISINDIEYITLDDPVVQGYRYLTFSGTLNSGVQNDAINIWYHTFKFSDREVYEAYGDAMIPPLVPSDCVSQDHLMLQAAIDLLMNMYAEDVVDDGASIRDDMTLYDPSPGIRARDGLIKQLRKQLDGLIQECIRSSLLGLEGVLID
jgi:hypothetical protein